VQAQKQQLDTALNNMAQGLVLFDASARVVLHNQRYIEMFGLSTDIVKPGVHFLDLLRHRTEIGSFAGDPDEFCSIIFQNLADGKASSGSIRPYRQAWSAPIYRVQSRANGASPCNLFPSS
jgi:PAS domain-containing protein